MVILSVNAVNIIMLLISLYWSYWQTRCVHILCIWCSLW